MLEEHSVQEYDSPSLILFISISIIGVGGGLADDSSSSL